MNERNNTGTLGPRGIAVALAVALIFPAVAGYAAYDIYSGGSSAAQPVHSFTGANANFAPNDPPGEWRSEARDYANTRFSPLNQINRSNVSRLKVAWTFADGTLYGHEGAPLVVGDTMYLVSPYPNVAYALDLSKPGAPMKWAYDAKTSPLAVGKACCDAVLRGWAYGNGKLIFNTLDDHVVAVDAKTGKELWRTKMDNVENGVTMTMAAFIAGNKVFVGNSGGEMGVTGWLAALDLNSGKELWRAYATGTDSDVKLGPDFQPFYAWMRGKNLGISTWPKGMYKTGAGSAWGFISYDPSSNSIYYGTSNPGPRVPAQRPGDNLFTSTVFARNADNGMAKWAYQYTPHDEWDYDGVNEHMLLNIPWQGQRRDVLVHFDRNGYAYTIDRRTGQVLVAAQYAYENWSPGIDMQSGRPIVNPAMEPKPGQTLKRVCPPDIGTKDWQPSAFSPRTGLVYTGIFNICMDLTDHVVSYIAGTPYDGMEMKRYAASGGNWGGFIAWDPVHGRKLWQIPEKFMVMSGTLATAGDVVFYGTVDGWFRAVDAWTGKVLWSQKLSSGVIGQPITFAGPDGRQYVAVYTGVGGAAMVSADEPGFPSRGGTLYVFSIDGQSPSSAPGMLVTDAKASASQPDETQKGRH
ncbi:MAG TPA: PQQ-dependent dehydrogenase, methanol/ethanol family [Sphingomicrobium sp.]|nr:PQQ-dependent dehydrogenase, methanol/ethanol family [Sphingomicrobium sp.]